jgi:hypothetical protein
MFLPAMGFITGVLCFTIAGVLVLSLWPSLRLTIGNLITFVASAMVAAVCSGAALNLLPTPFLDNDARILFVLGSVLVAAIVGGLAGALVRRRLSQGAA